MGSSGNNREEVHIGRGPRVRIETGWLVAVVAILAVVALAALVMVMAFDSGNRPDQNPAAAPGPTSTPIVITKEVVVVATPTPGPTPTPVVIVIEVPAVRAVIKEVVVTPTPGPTPTPIIVERVIEKIVVATPTPTPTPTGPRVVYRNDFEGAVGAEWSSRQTDLNPLKNRRFLGQFRKDTLTLTMTGLPSHEEVTVAFDLYVIGEWVGNELSAAVWTLSVYNGPTLLNTTFGSKGWQQSYPDTFPGGSNSARSGAAEVNTLGYINIGTFSRGDAVYKLSFTFQHSLEALRLNFSSFDPSASWGLDNVVVKVK